MLILKIGDTVKTRRGVIGEIVKIDDIAYLKLKDRDQLYTCSIQAIKVNYGKVGN